MKDISKFKDYRKKFKRHYGIEFSSDYVIHHIDFNRDNNEISNLLLMPRELHGRYHSSVSLIKQLYDKKGPSFTVDARIKTSMRENWHLSVLEAYAGVMAECSKWMDYKLFLDGRMPNVHGIVIE